MGRPEVGRKLCKKYLEQVVLGEERGPLSWLIRALLLPLALLYRLGLMAYLAIYSTGLRRRHLLPAQVISVGNLTFGGTGKTPAVIELCRTLTAQGRRVAVLSRGHGGKARGTLVASDETRVLSSADEAGDEPVMLARALPGVPVLVDRDRRRSGELACREFGPDVIVLDDGLQYWQLERDLDIVVVDAVRPFGSGFVMPMGDLREPISGLRRAGLILLSGVDCLSKAEREHLENRLAATSGAKPVLGCVRSPVFIRRLGEAQTQPAVTLRGRRAVAFCGIGRPGSFVDALESLGTTVLEYLAFPDHHNYSQADLAQVEESRRAHAAELVITTEKDAARLDAPPIEDLYVLGIELEIERRDWFGQYVADRLDGSHKASAS